MYLFYGLLFLQAVFKESSPAFNNCYLYFLTNDKNLYPLTYFIVLGSIEYGVFSNDLPFLSVNAMIILSNSVKFYQTYQKH